MCSPRNLIPAVALAVAAAAPAMAGVVVFDDLATFNAFAGAMPGTSVSVETFDKVSGFAPGGFSGYAGLPVEWSVSASTGMVAENGAVHAANANTAVTFSFASGKVYGLGGDFFYSSSNGSFVPGLMMLSLSDGTTFVRNVTSPSTFAGFWSMGPAISSLTIQPFGAAGTSNFVTTDNLSIGAVPAPGALALLGLAGLAARRRRP
jgi:MYXO-CTERM domain-containing protein